MALLLQIPTPARSQEYGALSAPLGAATASLQPPTAKRVPLRAELKSAHLARSYQSLIRRRLSLIPADLPFGEAAILTRLKEVDGQPGNRELMDRRVELEADMTILAQSIERSPPKEDKRERRKGRLSNVWDFLTAHTERVKLLLGEREGRLRYNVLLFFRSDLPASYLAEFGASTQWEMSALALATNACGQRFVQRLTERPVEEVNKELFMASEAPLQEVDRAFREYQKRLYAVTSFGDEVLRWRDALEYYVDLFSATNINRFRELREISVSSLRQEILDELTEGLRGATSELRRVLAEEYPGGLSALQWMPQDDAYVTGLVRLELEADQAG